MSDTKEKTRDVANFEIPNFLPKNYKLPDKAKQFMKLKVGENLIRVLSTPLLGYEIFCKDGEKYKPLRKDFFSGEFTEEELSKISVKMDSETKEPEKPKHFWMMFVWDYNDNAPKILEITQISILKTFYELANDKNWGDLRNYDISIKRSGNGINDTEYNVLPKPPKPLHEEINDCVKKIAENNLLDLSRIWKSEYPFLTYNF